MRRWLVGAGLAMTVVLVALGGLTLVNTMARQTVLEDHVYGFTGKAVSIDLTVGEVAIVPSTVDGQISVRRLLTYGLRRPVVSERIDGDTFRISDGDCPMPVETACHVKWLVQVPSKLHLAITTTSGSINVTPGMTGAVNLVSASGSVTARGVAGPAVQLLSHTGTVTGIGIRSTHLVASSDSGDISLSFRTAPKFVQGKSRSGSIEVLLPDGAETYKVTANAGGSRTVAANPDDLSNPSGRKVIVDSIKGNVTVEQSPPNPGS